MSLHPFRPRTAILALGLILGLARCGGDATAPADDGTTTVTLTAGLTFSPANLTIDPGTTVRWVSSTSTFHTITPNNIAQAGVWARATTSAAGTVLTHTFTISGEVYSYHCEVHAGMVGTVTVR